MARIGSTCLVLFGMWVALASSAWAQATPGYTMHQITYPGSTQTWVYGLNDKKNTVGLATMPDETYQGWFKKGSAYLRLKLPGICENCATPVAWNNLHEIIGQYPTDDADLDDSLASFEKVGSTVERIDLPGMRDPITKGINDAGDIVGTYIDPDFNRPHSSYTRTGATPH